MIGVHDWGCFGCPCRTSTTRAQGLSGSQVSVSAAFPWRTSFQAVAPTPARYLEIDPAAVPALVAAVVSTSRESADVVIGVLGQFGPPVSKSALGSDPVAVP